MVLCSFSMSGTWQWHRVVLVWGGGRRQVYQVFCIVSTDQSVAGMKDSQGEGWGRSVGPSGQR